MTIDTTLYSLPYIRRREAWREAYPVMATVFAQAFGVGSIVDVGCAGGLLVEALRKSGYDAWGLDGAPESESLWPQETRHNYLLADLTRPADIDLPATEFVCSLEVAEHLPEASASGYVTLLVRHRPRRVLFTAAPLGQPGLGHVNCQLFSYWIGLFAASGYQLDLPGSCCVRHELRSAVDASERMIVPRQYINNFLAFKPCDLLDRADRPEVHASIDLLTNELSAQRELLDFLIQRTANVTELIAILRRSVGEVTELSEADAWRLRSYAY